jgi:hypothetical protein
VANYGESILSRVLDEGNILSLTEFDVRQDDFSTSSERGTYDFIMDLPEKWQTPVSDNRA